MGQSKLHEQVTSYWDGLIAASPWGNEQRRTKMTMDNEHEQTTNDDLNDHAVERALRADAEQIAAECDALKAMLLEKNRNYGASALSPVRIFSKADTTEQIKVRLDDKLSRLARGSAAGEDVVLDVLGYLILLRIATRQAVREGIPEGFLKACKDAPSALDVLEDPDGPAAQPLFPGLMYAPDPMSVEDARVLVGPDVQIPPLPSRARLADEARVASQSGAVERLRNMSVSCTCGATFATTSAYFEHYDACLKSIGRAAFRQPNGARPRRLHRALAELYGTSDSDEILRRVEEDHLRAEYLERCARERDALWQLLDDIDTLDDSCRDDDRAFRSHTRVHQKKRFEIHHPAEEQLATAGKAAVRGVTDAVLGVSARRDNPFKQPHVHRRDVPWAEYDAEVRMRIAAYEGLIAIRKAAGLSAHEDADLPRYVETLRKDSESLTAAYQAAGISDLENLAAHIRTLRAERGGLAAELGSTQGALSAERAVAARDGALKYALDAIAGALHPHWGDSSGHTYLPNQLPDMIVALRKDRDGLLKDRRERVVIEASGRTVADRRALVALASEVGALLAYLGDGSRAGSVSDDVSEEKERLGRRKAYAYVRNRLLTPWDRLPQTLRDEALSLFGGKQ